jgi:putative flippase GtrA
MALLSKRLMNYRESRRFIRFAMIGVVGTAVDFGLLIVFKELVGLPTLLANTLSYGAGIVNNFVLNRIWTYPDSHSRNALLQLVQFGLVSVTGLLLNNLIVYWLDQPLGNLVGAADYGYLIAKVFATGLVMVWNFVVNRFWTFGDVE